MEEKISNNGENEKKETSFDNHEDYLIGNSLNENENLDESGNTTQTFQQKVVLFTKKIFTWNLLKPILCGQILSLLICGTAISSKFLQNQNVSVPLTQNFINYVLLGLTYTTVLCFKKDENGDRYLIKILKLHWWKYILLAVVDVEANFLVVKAYEYTSLTSVQLLDCFILPVVMILSYCILRIRYIAVHFVGVVIALIGVGCMVGADVLTEKEGTDTPGSNPALGDVMVLGSAVLYGISNVSMEYITKRHESGNFEILGMFGLFSPIICGVQMAALEWYNLKTIAWSWTIIGLFAAFGLCMFLLYSLLPLVMRLSSATTVNISLLTADLYALFAGLYLFNDQMSALYIVSFVTIVVSLIVFNSRQPVPRELPNSEANDDHTTEDVETSP